MHYVTSPKLTHSISLSLSHYWPSFLICCLRISISLDILYSWMYESWVGRISRYVYMSHGACIRRVPAGPGRPAMHRIHGQPSIYEYVYGIYRQRGKKHRPEIWVIHYSGSLVFNGIDPTNQTEAVIGRPPSSLASSLVEPRNPLGGFPSYWRWLGSEMRPVVEGGGVCMARIAGWIPYRPALHGSSSYLTI